jgi:hypothetical protein
VASIGLTSASWAFLRARRSHGFPRFFAWETILALVLLNGKYWFRYSSPLKIVATAVLLVSIASVVEGIRLLSYSDRFQWKQRQRQYPHERNQQDS